MSKEQTFVPDGADYFFRGEGCLNHLFSVEIVLQKKQPEHFSHPATFQET